MPDACPWLGPPYLNLMRKRELVALLLLPFGCLVTVNVLWLFLMVLWVGLQFVIVVFPDHTHLLAHLLGISKVRAKLSSLCIICSL